jgi:queuine tRNA-ribosyltransferase
VQGSVYTDLRVQSAEFIASTNAPGNAIGGLSVGEPAEEMYAMTDAVCAFLPEDKPRYLMGVGTPINILENIALGVDMFDCVMPSRNARNGMLFTSEGSINIKNKKWENDFSPIDPTVVALLTPPIARLICATYLLLMSCWASKSPPYITFPFICGWCAKPESIF